MGTFFPLRRGEGSDRRLGGRVYTPQLPKISPPASKKKKGRRFLRKVFHYVEKIAIPPNQFWPEIWRSLGGINPPYICLATYMSSKKATPIYNVPTRLATYMSSGPMKVREIDVNMGCYDILVQQYSNQIELQFTCHVCCSTRCCWPIGALYMLLLDKYVADVWTL
jgi:hypothetical protein